MYALYIDTPCNGKYHQFLKTKLQNYSKFLYQLLKKQRAQGQNYKTTLFFVCMTYIQTLNEREKVSRDQRPNNKTTPIYWMNLWKKSKGTGVKLQNYTVLCVCHLYWYSLWWKWSSVPKGQTATLLQILVSTLKKQRVQR